MTTAERAARLTIDLGSRELLRRLKVAAAENDMTVRNIVIEAVNFWLDHQDDVENVLAREKIARVTAESSGEYIAHADVVRP